MVYAVFVGRLGGRPWRLVVPGVLGVWAVVVDLLWPQLLTSYSGYPPAAATAITCVDPDVARDIWRFDIVRPGTDSRHRLLRHDVARDIWRFDIVGHVESPTRWTFHELAALPAVVQETTLQCISYGIGSGLISNAVWKGVPLPTLLARAKPKADCGGVLFHAVDGFFETIPLAKLGEATTLIAYEMNGAPLPPRHGFPMRLIVPGIYGERNPKWVTRLEFIQKDDPRLKINRHGIEGVGFYTEQGWGPNVYVPTTSRIDAPARGGDFNEPFKVGQPVEFRGMA